LKKNDDISLILVSIDEDNINNGIKIDSININDELNQNIILTHKNDKISNKIETLPNFDL